MSFPHNQRAEDYFLDEHITEKTHIIKICDNL